nr:MAG TPA: hypothetical protein [Caudoviricetes sp.]DAV27326.1 MAG TPA: hypothetical protein [Caudoviricetes sp.]DAY81543.1 MAG TPA: hypothetical protein [Caudoviricetes sp.]
MAIFIRLKINTLQESGIFFSKKYRVQRSKMD